jgi:hypothetical protein
VAAPRMSRRPAIEYGTIEQSGTTELKKSDAIYENL